MAFYGMTMPRSMRYTLESFILMNPKHVSALNCMMRNKCFLYCQNKDAEEVFIFFLRNNNQALELIQFIDDDDDLHIDYWTFSFS